MRDGTCAWAAVDIDTGDLGAALDLQRLLCDSNLPAIVLTSRAKGYHVTVFFSGWASAKRTRMVLQHFVEEVGLDPKTEIFPKADISDSIGAGNYLRLPYIGVRPEGTRSARFSCEPGRRVALDPHDRWRALSLEDFLDLAEARLIVPATMDLAFDSLQPEELEPPRDDILATPNRLRLPSDPSDLGLSPELAALVWDGWVSESRYRSRSEAQQAVVDGLVNAGHNDSVIHAVLTSPGYGISERALQQSARTQADQIDRCISKGRASRVMGPSVPGVPRDIELHRRMLPPLAWPVLFEIRATTDQTTGFSLVTARSLALRLGVDQSTVHRSALRPLRQLGLLESVPFERHAGQWQRVAHRIVSASRPSREPSPGPFQAEKRVEGEGV